MKKLGCILLIDDSDTDNFIHTRRLGKMEVAEEIVVRANGREGIQYFTTPLPGGGHPTRPDILFLDINMPVMDGWEFLEKYRHLPVERRARLTILMITSSVGDTDEERVRNLDFVAGHEATPLTKDKIRALLDKHFPGTAMA